MICARIGSCGYHSDISLVEGTHASMNPSIPLAFLDSEWYANFVVLCHDLSEIISES
jgi:hypothetical protein